MGYIRAEEILPAELVELLQEYVDGQTIYVPRKSDKKVGWGTVSGTKKKLAQRNERIYLEYLEGMKVEELAEKYYLSEKSIQRIIREMKL